MTDMSHYLTKDGEIDSGHLKSMGLTATEIHQVFCTKEHTEKRCAHCGKPESYKSKIGDGLGGQFWRRWRGKND